MPIGVPLFASRGGRPSRRSLLQSAAAGIGAAITWPAHAASAAEAAPAVDVRPLTDVEKVSRLASNTYPLRGLFKRHPSVTSPSPGGQAASSEAMKKKYGEITMLDMPQFTLEHFPGIRKMDLWSSLFGDVTDESMFVKTPWTRDGRTGVSYEFDPKSAAGRKWLEQLNGRMAKAGVSCHHVSNNAPRNISDLEPELRRQGIETAKAWLDACGVIGAKTMRVNTGGPRIAPGATATTGYPRNDEIVKYIRNAVDSFKEMADYGAKVDVKVTIENHWGLSADPMNMRIILDEVNHPYCEASPDFCNWEHEYLLYHGLEALLPYTHSTVHAKYWNRWQHVDVQRCVRVLTNGGFKGVFALEYEDGPWDGLEGAKYLMKEVLAAL